jgi:hypothetical protein
MPRVASFPIELSPLCLSEEDSRIVLPRVNQESPNLNDDIVVVIAPDEETLLSITELAPETSGRWANG